MLTTEQLIKILPNTHNADALCSALNKVLPTYGINTKNRIAGFLAQCAVESSEFNVLEENLNYGAQGLMSTWKSKFPTIDIANQYARQPEKIANYVYANKLGNGPESSGEGWKFRGHGAIQLTGKDAWLLFAKFKGISLDQALELTKTLEGAVVSGCYYWNSRNINAAADADDIKKMTMLVNGPALLALDKRTQYYNKAKSVL
jgi:putative chitinase